MTLNKQAFKLAGVTVDEFKNWCKENKKPMYLKSSKREFFARIHDGRIIRDTDGKLIKTRRRNAQD